MRLKPKSLDRLKFILSKTPGEIEHLWQSRVLSLKDAKLYAYLQAWSTMGRHAVSDELQGLYTQRLGITAFYYRYLKILNLRGEIEQMILVERTIANPPREVPQLKLGKRR